MRVIYFIVILMMQPIFANAQSGGDDQFPGFILRNADSIEAAADKLEKELGDKGMVFEIIGNHKGHSLYLVLRGKTGTSENHLTESDYYISKRGTATLIIGGELIEPKELARKQIRGTGIKGGVSHTLKPGDFIHVPPNTPHHLIIGTEQPYMYLLFKIDEEPLN